MDRNKVGLGVGAVAGLGLAAYLLQRSGEKKTTKKKGKEPWWSWEHELPSTKEGPRMENFSILNDPDYFARMHQELRERALGALRKALPSTQAAAVLLAGGTSGDWALYDTDTDKDAFRQEPFFRYLFAINEPDCFGVMDLERGESLLFVPPVTDDMQRWNGPRLPLSHYTERYRVKDTYLTTDLDDVLSSRGITRLHLLLGENTDSGSLSSLAPVEAIPGVKGEKYELEKELLYPLLVELRVVKTAMEQELMRMGCLLSSQAHVYVMRHIKPGMAELQLEALFRAWILYHAGARHVAYTCICGSGSNGSILHYGHAGRPNTRILTTGDSVVLDMGGEYHGYTSDLTRSYPVGGKFTEDQRAIFNAVKEAQEVVFAQLKPGVSWQQMHRDSERVILRHLIQIGILYNGTVEEMEEAFMGAVFMPHGLGHLLGMCVHDVGGYPNGSKRSAEPGLCWLRMGRPVKEGMVLTVEPGVYFNDPTLDRALANPAQRKFMNEKVLQRFRGTGGFRLEDDVLVTADGMENWSIMPSTVEEIEEVMADAQL